MDEAIRQGPAINETMLEVHGIFPSDAALQEAVGLLTRGGFDRARLSLPAANPSLVNATPSAGAEDPNTEDDARQMRTLQSSTAAAAAGMAGAALTVATGGVAAAVAAAVGAGALVGGSVFAAQTAANNAQHEGREEAAAQGKLVLSVAVDDQAQGTEAATYLQQAGASRVEMVRREGAAIAAVGQGAVPR